MPAKRVAIIGSGNWGSAIARIVGANAARCPEFENEVRMWVFEETIDGRKLTEIINTDHENVKYLPGKKLPENVVAVPDVLTTCLDADILIFVIPHKFLPATCKPLIGNIKSGAVGISLIKGFGETSEPGEICLLSESITALLGIECAALMGANLANEVAEEKFCETTIGVANAAAGADLKLLFDTPNFRVTVVPDKNTVEICGALKNIVACAAGFADGLGYGDNTKSAVIRIGLKEMVRFCKTFYGNGLQLTTFFESCGVADLITTCYGGRNRKVSEAFVRTGKDIEVLEKELLNGQKLQGFQTAEEVFHMLKKRNQLERFPLFVAVHRICSKELPPAALITELQNEPDEM